MREGVGITPREQNYSKIPQKIRPRRSSYIISLQFHCRIVFLMKVKKKNIRVRFLILGNKSIRIAIIKKKHYCTKENSCLPLLQGWQFLTCISPALNKPFSAPSDTCRACHTTSLIQPTKFTVFFRERIYGFFYRNHKHTFFCGCSTDLGRKTWKLFFFYHNIN